MPDEQPQMQEQAPSGQDWGSIATSLIPAAAGLFLGGPGTLAGAFAAGEERRKYEREQALREREAARLEERLKIERDQETRLQTRANAENKHLELQTRHLDMTLQDEESARQGLSPEELKLYLQLGKEGYRKDRLQRMGIESAGRFLPAMNSKLFPTAERAQDFARIMGDHLGGYLIEEEKARLEPKREWYPTADGRIINTRTGEIKEEPAEMSPRERMQAKGKLLEAYNKLPDIERLQTPFDRWVNAPSGLEARRMLGLIDDQQYTDLRSFAESENKRDQQSAYSQMFSDWQGKQFRWSAKDEATFRQYLQTQKGSEEFDTYIRNQSMRGNQRNLPVEETQPAKHPVEMAPKEAPLPTQTGKPIVQNPDGSVSTERTITVEADGRHYLIPTIIDGKEVSKDEAIRQWRAGKNKAVGIYSSAQEAESAAEKRSRDIGEEITRGKSQTRAKTFNELLKKRLGQ